MKKLLTVLVAIFATCNVMMLAQSSQLATLSHKGTIKTFYGTSALSSALSAAVNGDVITLSSGSFNGVDITKAVTIRGAGVGMDTTSQALPTIINSNFTINVPANDSSNLILEGIYHGDLINIVKAARPMFLKCRFKAFVRKFIDNTSEITDATFMHCMAETMSLQNTGSSLDPVCSGTIINSAFGSTSIKNFTCTNCIFLSLNQAYAANNTFYNCIIVASSTMMSSNVAFNCIGYSKSNTSSFIFSNLPNNSSNQKCNPTEVFDSGSASYADNEVTLFQLSDTGKSYKGNDGKEVGIYGGNMPFDLRTTTPQIKKCNVAAKSTADGKLSVDIEVSTIE